MSIRCNDIKHVNSYIYILDIYVLIIFPSNKTYSCPELHKENLNAVVYVTNRHLLKLQQVKCRRSHTQDSAKWFLLYPLIQSIDRQSKHYWSDKSLGAQRNYIAPQKKEKWNPTKIVINQRSIIEGDTRSHFQPVNVGVCRVLDHRNHHFIEPGPLQNSSRHHFPCGQEQQLRSIPQAAIDFDAFSPSKHDQNLNGCRGFSSQSRLILIFFTPQIEKPWWM